MKSASIVMNFLLLAITDLASSYSVEYVVYEVEVTVYNRVTNPIRLQGYSYPSSPKTRDYSRNICELEIYNVTSRDTHCVQPPQLPSDNCTFVYFEDTCPTGLILLAEVAKKNGREAVIYRTQHINETLKTLIKVNVSRIPVILVQDPLYIIRRYKNQNSRYVNVTLVAQTSLPPDKPNITLNNEEDEEDDDTQNNNTLTVYIVGFAFAAILLVGILILILAVIVYYKCRHRGTRQIKVRNIFFFVIVYAAICYQLITGSV